MPEQSVWMIRLSMISLLIAITIGGVLLIHKATPLHPGVWALLPVACQLAIWGWRVRFVMGTAYWMGPRHLTGGARGADARGWIVFPLFNARVLLLVRGHPLATLPFL